MTEQPDIMPLPWIFEAIENLDPDIEAAKVGTEHEGHVGWGMNTDGPGVVQCGCGASLSQAIAAYDRRQREAADG